MTLFLLFISIWIRMEWVKSDDGETEVFDEIYLSDSPKVPAKFKIYVYIPTDHCRTQRNFTKFTHFLQKSSPDYSSVAASPDKLMIFNENMADEGDVVNLFYTPGTWPRIEYRSTSPNPGASTFKKYICGGIPQNCHISTHVSRVRQLFKAKPKKDLPGLGVLTVGHWRPIWRQNTRWDKAIYQIESVNRELKDPKNNNSDLIKAKAQVAFEKAAMEWFKDTIDEAVVSKKKILWGYMGLPSCYNKGTKDGSCSLFSKQDNIRLSIIVQASRALYPTGFLEDPKTYRNYHLDGEVYLKNLLKETFRVAKINPPRRHIVVVIRYKYRNGHPMSVKDFIKSITVPCLEGADAVLIYGGHKDAKECDETWKHFKNIIEIAVNSSEVAACKKHYYPWYQKPHPIT